MPGGHFTVRVQLHGNQLRVETHDNGGPWTWPEHPSEQTARILIVSKLARAWGRSGDSDTGWTVWFGTAHDRAHATRRVCPECGSVADADPPTTCPSCHAFLSARWARLVMC